MQAALFAFLSHTQRDPNAKLLATELWTEFKDAHQKRCWLDVKMEQRDVAAMEVHDVTPCHTMSPHAVAGFGGMGGSSSH